MAPLPPTVETTGAPSFSASCHQRFRIRPADRRTPPPAKMTGRCAEFSSAAASRINSPPRGTLRRCHVERGHRRAPPSAPAGRPAGSPPRSARRGAERRQRVGVGDQTGNLGGVAHRRDAFGDVDRAGLLIIELVQHAAAQAHARSRYLAGDHQHRHPGGVSLLQRAQRGQRTGAGGQEQHADLAGHPAVARRRRTRSCSPPGS